jgi:hypothetical protein
MLVAWSELLKKLKAKTVHSMRITRVNICVMKDLISKKQRTAVWLSTMTALLRDEKEYTKKSLIFKWLNMWYKIKYISFVIILKI